jgi:hypothetical protein
VQWEEVANKFNEKWNFPHCVGALYGKHIVMQAPSNSGSYYFNYKGTHSIVLMALVDADYKFLFIDVGCNGRISDGGVFGNSKLSGALEENAWEIPPPKALSGRQKDTPYVIVADDAFPIRCNIMKPYPFKGLSGTERVFNYRLSRARRIVENAFGILANVFRVFRKPLLIGSDKSVKVVLASCALHNYLLSNKHAKPNYVPPAALDWEDPVTHEVHSGLWRNDNQAAGGTFSGLPHQGSNFSALDARQVRDEFRDYFVSIEGEVSWQYRYI